MKDKIKEVMESFFISVTLIDLAIFILGMLLRPDQQFGYEVFVYPLIYGIIGCIPTLLINIDKELSVKQVLIRKALQMLLIIVLLVAFIFGGNPINSETVITALGVSASVVVIYVAVNVIIWFLDLKMAEKLTAGLKRYQDTYQRDGSQ